MPAKTVIAIAGAGDMAKYIVDAAVAHGNVHVVVLSRTNKAWFAQRSPAVSLHVTDYSVASVRAILDATQATALFSVIHTFDAAVYLPLHRALLAAAQQAPSCTRFSPSYYAGNIDDFPGIPAFYQDGHQAFRDELAALPPAAGLQWTVINQGWIMDYVAIFEDEGAYGPKSYMKSAQSIWPIDMKAWTATVQGTGNEPAAFTAAADVGRAVVALGVTSEPWPQHTYLQGEQTTWNVLLQKLEAFYDRKLVDVKHASLDEIRKELQSVSQDDPYAALLQISEWTALGGQGLPQEAVVAQRETFFADINFQTVDELLAASKEGRI